MPVHLSEAHATPICSLAGWKWGTRDVTFWIVIQRGIFPSLMGNPILGGIKKAPLYSGGLHVLIGRALTRSLI